MIVKGGVPIRRIPKAPSVSIQAGQRVFHKRADGSYEPASITLKAEIKNVNNPTFAWGRIVNGIFQSNGVIYNTLVVSPAYTGVIAVRVRGDNIPNYIEEYTSISVVDDGAPAVQYKIVVKQLENIVTSIPCDANGSPKIYYQATAHLYKVTGDVEELCADYVCVVGYQKNGNTVSTVTSDSYTSSLTFDVSGDYESVRIGFTDGTNVIADVTIPKLYDGQPGVTYSIEVTRGSTRITALSCNADGSLKGINEFDGKFYKTIGNKKEACGFKFIIYGYKSDGSLGIVFHCSTTVGEFGSMYFADKNWDKYEGILVSCYEGNDRKNIICELMLPKIIDGQSGEAGQKGLPGCAIRRSEWKAGIEYRNDEAINAVTRYIDITMVRAKNSIGWRGYKCLQTHVSAESNKPGNATYWEELPTSTVGILASLIIARDAKLDFLSGNEIRILDANDSVTAGVSGSGNGETGIRFYAGSDDPKNAPYRVNELGELYSTKANIRGQIYQDWYYITKYEAFEYLYIVDKPNVLLIGWDWDSNVMLIVPKNANLRMNTPSQFAFFNTTRYTAKISTFFNDSFNVFLRDGVDICEVAYPKQINLMAYCRLELMFIPSSVVIDDELNMEVYNGEWYVLNQYDFSLSSDKRILTSKAMG